MKTEVTKVTDRGQVSIPASVRKRLGLSPGQRVSWAVESDHVCRITIVEPTVGRLGADAMRGYARTFRKTRTTDAWMRELREGEGA